MRRPYRNAIATLLLMLPVLVLADPRPEAAEQALHILDYVAVDYADAVNEGGRVQDADEYHEQQEFAEQLVALTARLPDNGHKAELHALTRELAMTIDDRAAAAKVQALARHISAGLTSAYAITTAPSALPPLERAPALFAEHCAACHGAAGMGDGPRAAALTPAPANFHDAVRQSRRSLYGLYATIGHGVEGTAMPAFTALSNAERWALAIHAAGFAINPAEREHGEREWQQGEYRSLFSNADAVTNAVPADVRATHGNGAADTLVYLRSRPGLWLGQDQPTAALDISLAKLHESVELYQRGDADSAYDAALGAYLQGFELAEAGLRTVAPDLRETLEARLAGYRKALQEGISAEAAAHQADEIRVLLEEAKGHLGGATLSPITGAVSAFLLLLREGVEAILVLAAIVAFLVKTERRDSLRHVHTGWIGALALGVLTWFVAAHFIVVSGANREITEGLIALIAAAMLIYVGFWLHNHSHAQQWKNYIQGKLHHGGGSLWTLVAISFLAVYREVFETILFFQSLWLQTASAHHGYLLAGLAGAAVVLVGLAWAVFRFSVRLPVRLFFQVNAVLLYTLAVIFVGKGIAALQEADALPYSPVNFPEVDLIGIYPALESLMAQAVLIGAAIGWIVYRRSRNHQVPAN